MHDPWPLVPGYYFLFGFVLDSSVDRILPPIDDDHSPKVWRVEQHRALIDGILGNDFTLGILPLVKSSRRACYETPTPPCGSAYAIDNVF